MATIIQHRPDYVSGFENEKIQFTSVVELLNIKFVDNFKRTFYGNINFDFYRYSISKYSDHKGYEYALMAEFKNGAEWWVVGFIDEYEVIKELPVFEEEEETNQYIRKISNS